jgi:hypothetical protein
MRTVHRAPTLRNMMNRTLLTARARSVLAAMALPALLGACDSLLDVQNPSYIAEGDLNDPELVDFMVNGVVGEFQRMYTPQAMYAAIFTDELVTGGTFYANRPWDKRLLDDNHPYVTSRYAAVHRARGAADSLATRVETLLGDKASSHLGLARARAYGGYTYVLLGEQFCASPINQGKALSPNELLALGVERFDEAIRVATAARAGGAKAAAADSIINLARVGAARAHLQMGNKAKAIEYARQVPPAFQIWVAHSGNSTVQNNPFFEEVTNLEKLVVDEPFLNLDDPRVPHTAELKTLEDNRKGFEPFQSFAYSGWSAAEPVVFEKETNLRFASGLEARYILAEAGGLSPAELRAFIDERRAVGNQGAFAGSNAQLMAELRDQRRRDFFLAGHRFGDLRRYKDQDGIDLFPKGEYPQTNELYSDAVCIPIPSSEKNSNPNL